MSKAVRRFLAFFLVLQLVIPYSTFAAAVGEFTSITGTVTQARAAKVIKPVEKSPIQLKDIVITDQASSAMMAFSDSSMITLGQNSKLEINQFLFEKKSRAAIFFLSIGQVTATVSKFIGGDNIFEVRSPTSVLGVRGTGFDFIESKDEDKTKSTVRCTDGSLNLSALSDTGAVVSTAVLEAGQMAVIAGGIITISMIGAVTAAGGASTAAATSSTATGTAATAGAGLSTGAIVGITAAGIVGTGAVVAAAGGGGGGGGNTSTTYDATGTWNWINTYDTNDCGAPVEYDTDTVTLEQTGTTFTIFSHGAGTSASGTVSKDTYTFTNAFEEDFGTTTDKTTAILSSSTSGTYTTDWTWTDGTHSCSGVEKGTISKVQ